MSDLDRSLAISVLQEFEWFRKIEVRESERIVSLFLEGWRRAGQPDMRQYAQRWGTKEIHRDVLVAVKPDEESGRRYLQGLHKRFGETGIDGEWGMFMVRSATPGSQAYIWLHHQPDPYLDTQRPGQECLACLKACEGAVSSRTLTPP